MDSRTLQLAQNLIRYSTALQPGENILSKCLMTRSRWLRRWWWSLPGRRCSIFITQEQPATTKIAIWRLQRTTTIHRRLGIRTNAFYAGLHRNSRQREHQ